MSITYLAWTHSALEFLPGKQDSFIGSNFLCGPLLDSLDVCVVFDGQINVYLPRVPVGKFLPLAHGHEVDVVSRHSGFP